MKRNKRDGFNPYVQLPYDLLNSAAWTALPDKAVWVYIELKKQFNFDQGGNLHLVLPYSSVAWRMSRGSFFAAIRRLMEYGFIIKRESGGLFRRPNVYSLSENWRARSQEIVCREGKEAIRQGLAKKPTHRDNAKNLLQFMKSNSEGKSND
jgi:DNA-binding PadR family transcriptional regulator